MANPRLRTAIIAARPYRCGRQHQARHPARHGELEGGQIDEVMFEGYGPAAPPSWSTWHRTTANRTVSEIPPPVHQYNGKMGEQNSVARLFVRKSQVSSPPRRPPKERLMDTALDAGVEDIRNDGVNWEILSPPEAHLPVLELCKKPAFSPPRRRSP